MAIQFELVGAPARVGIASLVQRYGGAVSTALLDPTCTVFRAPDIDGAIGYRHAMGCAVVLGEPVCAERDKAQLAHAFREFCVARGWYTVYAAANERFAQWAVGQGYSAVGFGTELILDPRRDPAQGHAGRELRKKVLRAAREGLELEEYRPGAVWDVELERAMERVAAAWLAARRGPQIYVARVNLFGERSGRRWFYARTHGNVVGVLSAVWLQTRAGYLLEHHLVAPDAPIGTSEVLVTRALEAFRRDGCECATFGPAPAAELGHVWNLSPWSERLARAGFRAAGRLFHLDARTHYRRKFRPAREEQSFVLFAERRVGLRSIVGILRAFNVSLAAPRRELLGAEETSAAWKAASRGADTPAPQGAARPRELPHRA
jgi:lysylphosphatidylglycerol synthetase-like protein (DUF2156 family)